MELAKTVRFHGGTRIVFTPSNLNGTQCMQDNADHVRVVIISWQKMWGELNYEGSSSLCPTTERKLNEINRASFA